MTGERARVLFVDDEERILRSLKRMFKDTYEVRTATDPNQGIQIIADDPIDVVISDQRMPQMQGVEFLREVSERSPATTRILLTGYSDMGPMVRAVNEGEIFRYVQKPWDPEGLKETMADAVGVAGAARDALAEQASETEQRDHEGTPAVLVLDRDPDTVELVETLMDGIARVHAASTIDEAFELLAATDIGVIVADLTIGERDISDAIKELKATAPHIQTIVTTANQNRESLFGLINEGRIGRYLPKPLSHQLLGRSINQLRVRARAEAQRPKLQAAEMPARQEHIERPVRERIAGFLDRLRGQQEAPP